MSRGSSGLADGFDPLARQADRAQATDRIFRRGRQEQPNDEVPKQAPRKSTTARATRGNTVTTAATDLPMPPPKVRKVPRTQLNARVRADIDALLSRFVSEQQVGVQDTLDLAILEFLNRRGYLLPEQEEDGQ
jgi:hypothetical protein